MPPQERLRLDNEQGLLPCMRRSSQKNQDHPIPLRACWSFDLPTEDDELLPEEGVFCHEFGLPPGKVSHRSYYERGASRLCPVDEAVIECSKAVACQSLDGGEKAMHSVQFSFMKMSRSMRFDSTLPLENRQGARDARKCSQKASFGGRISQVASTSGSLEKDMVVCEDQFR